MQRLRKLKGFTLIELIVVVIIIGILAAVASLAYNKFIGDARVSAAKATAKTVATKLTALGAQSADGDTAAYVKGAATLTKLKADLGADSSIGFFKDGAGAVLADADIAAVKGYDAVPANSYGSSIYVGTAAHNCELKLAETAVLGVCK